MLRVNLHNHTTFSDGSLSPREVVEAALRSSLAGVGISDHYANRKLDPSRSVGAGGIAEYAREIRALRAEYADRIAVRAGIEVAFSPFLTDLTSLALGRPDSPLEELDFVLFEYVEESEWAGLGLADLIQAKRLIRSPVGLAHPDLDRHFSSRYAPEVLARLLDENRIFVELCPASRNSRAAPGSGASLPYYRAGGEYLAKLFHEFRERGVGLSIGTDSHHSAEEVGAIEDALRFIEEQGLERGIAAAAVFEPCATRGNP